LAGLEQRGVFYHDNEQGYFVCLSSSQYTQEQTGCLFLRKRSYLTMSSLNNLCRTNEVRLEEFMNYICAGTLFSVHSFDHFNLKLVLIGCTILKGSEVSEMLPGFMYFTTRNRRMNG